MKGPTMLLYGVFVLLNTKAIMLSAEIPTMSSIPSENHISCNNCCHGPVGSPGIPGIPGNHGIPGGLAPKGDRGESVKGDIGLEGLKGDKGSVGSVGERGMSGERGPPGKRGPDGISGEPGLPGSEGISGPMGPPGPKGQGDMGNTRVSAFSAARSTRYTVSATGDSLPFDEQVHTNIGGDFDAGTGRFTCEIAGVYLFTYSIMSSQTDSLIALMKNDYRINSAHRQKSSDFRRDMVSNSAVLHLNAEDQVWLGCYSGYNVDDHSNHYTTFSGVILHEI